MPNSSPNEFKVSISSAQNQILIDGAEWAAKQKLKKEFLASLKEIEFRLKFEPDDWGEGREFLPKLQIHMRCGTCRMISVLYGVDDRRRVVYVKRFRINKRYRP